MLQLGFALFQLGSYSLESLDSVGSESLLFWLKQTMPAETTLVEPKLDVKTRLKFSAQITHRYCFSGNYICNFLTKACAHSTQKAFNLMKLVRKWQESTPQALVRRLSLKIFTWFMEFRESSVLKITHQYLVSLLRLSRVEVHMDSCNGTCRHDNVFSFSASRQR